MNTDSQYASNIDAILAAQQRIRGRAHITPIATCETIDRISGRRLFFKCEHLQKVGAFKFRGACNAVLSLDAAVAARGVATHSSGNHAQALALAARLRGIPAHIVMPETVAAVKRQAVESYGGRVILCEATLAARETTAASVVEETGADLVHPYNDPRVISGQGTAALELLDQVADLDAVVVPVGGGGLLSGTCLTLRALAPNVKIIGAEPAGADDAARSFAAGELIPLTAPNTIADGLVTSLGQLTWPIIRDHVETIVTVSEEEIRNALRLAWERAKLLIEPSSAVALAAVLSESFRRRPAMTRIGVMLTGGNVDIANVASWLGR